MKLSPLITQFTKFLPKYTSLFSDTFDVSSVDIAGSLITVTTVDDYAFDSAWVHMSVIFEGIPIDSFTYDDVSGEVTCNTLLDHGLTLAMNLRTRQKSPLTVTLTNNTDTTLNGDFPLLEVPNRFKFVFQFTAGLGSIVIDGFVVNYATNRLEGLQEITQTSANTFTYDVGVDLTGVTAVTSGTVVAAGNIRISGAADLKRAVDSYTRITQNSDFQDKFWLLLVYGDSFASKDRGILNDAIATGRLASDPRQLLIEEFSAVVFAPTPNSISGRTERDEIENVKVALFKTILNFPSVNDFVEDEQYTYMFTSGNEVSYNSAYLAYQFNFQTQTDVTFGDMFTDASIVPFRNIDGWITIDESSTQLSFDVNLDEDP